MATSKEIGTVDGAGIDNNINIKPYTGPDISTRLSDDAWSSILQNVEKYSVGQLWLALRTGKETVGLANRLLALWLDRHSVRTRSLRNATVIQTRCPGARINLICRKMLQPSEINALVNLQSSLHTLEIGITTFRELDLALWQNLSSLTLVNSVWGSNLQSMAICHRLKHLDISECRHLESVEGLAGCTGLEILNMRDLSSVNTLQPLASCIRLEKLNIRECESVDSVVPLQSCVNMRELQLCGSGVTNVDALNNCANLSELHMNPVTQVTLPGLNKLVYENGSAVDLTDIQGCSTIETLVITHCYNINGINGWQIFTNLRNLTLRPIGIGIRFDFSSLESCTSLVNVDIQLGEFPSVELLQNCVNLETVRLRRLGYVFEHHEIEFPNLKVLDMRCVNNDKFKYVWPTLPKLIELKYSDMTCLRHLSQLPSLRKLHVSSISSLVGIHNCPNLTFLYVSYSKVRSLRPVFDGCPKLRKLFFENSMVTSLKGIEKCPQLHTVVGCAKLKSVDELVKCKELKILVLRGILLRSVDILAKCPALERLDLKDSSVESVQAFVQRGIKIIF